MNAVEYVFVVLVYRNISDLESLINSIRGHNLNAGIVIVNSYYDDDSLSQCKEIAGINNCEFLNVENKGYSYGNNRGIEYANQKFQYEFLIVCNPDILIKKFDTNVLSKLKGSVIGPIIYTLRGKNQNPYWYFNNRISEWLIYKGYKNKSRLTLYLGIGINKIIRELFLMYYKKSDIENSKVFALHGCFVIFSHEALKKIILPYDDDMFLFAEEAHLAHLLRSRSINSYITKGVEVLHKEDGSIAMGNIDEKSYIRESVIKYYEKLKQFQHCP